MTDEAKLLFFTRDSLERQLRVNALELKEARRRHYGRQVLPSLEAFRREIGA